jgi:hypothetical protein
LNRRVPSGTRRFFVGFSAFYARTILRFRNTNDPAVPKSDSAWPVEFVLADGTKPASVLDVRKQVGHFAGSLLRFGWRAVH